MISFSNWRVNRHRCKISLAFAIRFIGRYWRSHFLFLIPIKASLVSCLCRFLVPILPSLSHFLKTLIMSHIKPSWSSHSLIHLFKVSSFKHNLVQSLVWFIFHCEEAFVIFNWIWKVINWLKRFSKVCLGINLHYRFQLL